MFTKESDIIYGKLVRGVRQFFKESGKERAVLGLSGGLDSAVVLCIAKDALGNENVHSILMPSPFSTLHSVADAVELSENLKVNYLIVPIDTVYSRYLKLMEELFCGEVKEIVLENIQARIRSAILMAYCNNTGSLLLNTSNKSELAMGYGTLYGDLSGALMVLADLYKLQVYSLAHYINSVEKVIPDSTLTKEPSAELRVGQKDSDSFPEYSILDPILYSMVEEKKSITELIREGGNRAVIEKIERLKEASSFKTHQMPPMLQLGDNPLLPLYKCIKCN